MSHYNSSGDNIVQEFSGVGGMYASPVYFNGKVYFWGSGDVVKAFTVTNGLLSTTPTDQGAKDFGFPGATPAISANGTSNAILWALEEDAFVDNGVAAPPFSTLTMQTIFQQVPFTIQTKTAAGTIRAEPLSLRSRRWPTERCTWERTSN